VRYLRNIFVYIEREVGGGGGDLVTRKGRQEGPAICFARTCRRLVEFVEKCAAI
jgi:hypothetical protein